MSDTTLSQLLSKVEGLFIGEAKMLWDGRPPSAIDKNRVEGTINVSPAGLVGDQQADRTVHGGVEKAVHHYPADHYPYWTDELGENERFAPGGFGENISSFGITEDAVCIGDIFRIGSAYLQISQGRQPCWKLAAHADIKRLPFLVQKTARTGWYYRVLQEGQITDGDSIELVDRPQPKWAVKTVTKCRFDGKIAKSLATELSEIQELAPGWRDAFAKRAGGTKEDSSKRLDG